MNVSTYLLRKALYKFSPVLIGNRQEISFSLVSKNLNCGHLFSSADVAQQYSKDSPLYIVDYNQFKNMERFPASAAAVIVTSVTDIKEPEFLHHDFPILVLTQASTVEEVYDYLMLMIFSMHFDDSLVQDLMSIYTSGGTLMSIIQKASQYLSLPIIVIRRDKQILAETITFLSEHALNTSLSLPSLSKKSPALCETFLNDILENSRNRNRAIYVSADNMGAVSFPLNIKGFHFGSIALLLVDRHSTWHDYYVVTLIANVISAWLQHKGDLAESDTTAWGDYMRDLLNGRIDISLTPEELERRGIVFPSEMQLVQIAKRENTSAKSSDLYREIKFDLKSLFPNDKFFSLNKNVILIINSKENLDHPIHKNQMFQHLLHRRNCIAAISNPFSYFLGIKTYYEQTNHVLHLLFDSGKEYLSKQHYIFSYKDFVLEHILSICSQAVPLESLCHPATIALRKYDEKNSTSYFETLRVYLEYNSNIPAVSHELRVHYNTVKYRMKVISSLTDLDLSQTETRSALRMSFMILDHLEK